MRMSVAKHSDDADRTRELETSGLASLIDTRMVESMMEDFYRLTHIPTAIIDFEGKLVAGAGGQRICPTHHRAHPDSRRNCIESDIYMTAAAPPGEFRVYKCSNNMWDAATPLMIGEQPVANLFAGQFFFDDEPVDEDLFRAQAERYGWDEAAYLERLREAPRLSRETIGWGMAYLVKAAHFLSQLSYTNAELRRAVAERDALTRELKQSEDRLKRAHSIAHVGAWELELGSGRLSWSDEVYRIVDLKPQEFRASYEAFLEVVHPDDRAAVDGAYRDSLRDGGRAYEITHRVTRRGSGEVRWVREKCEHIRNEAGEVTLSIGMVQDITEHHLAEEQVRRKQKLEGVAMLAAGVAHDFNNLLVSVLGNASLARDTLEPNHPGAAMLDSVISAGQKAADLTRAMLSCAGKGRRIVEAFDLSAVVREMTALVRATIPNKVRLNLDLAGGLPLVKGDASQIQRVLMNLLINAAEAIGDRPGEICVSTRLESLAAEEGGAAQIRLEVTDTGCGMDAATQSRMFDPFFTSKPNGCGLGLAGVAGILIGHNARIQVHSAPGKGTRLTVLFMALTTDAEPGVGPPEPEPAARGGTVLVVDDDELVRDVARKALERFGYAVLTASSATEAIAICERASQPVDVALLDSSVPGICGPEALPALVRLRPGLRVILTSGYGGDDIVGRCLGQAVHGFIQKPYSPAALREQVQAAMGKQTPPEAPPID
jgi:PAS domain S-box-containing protein